ncbi:MAG: DUF2589 domain-containing protein [Bacteroidales bacterium]|jgi:hypothetical protein|nr:DUF2589 domain-containing protein [Bacteroidales bacterium]
MAISDNDEDVHSFDDIIKGFQYAVNSAQEMLVAHHLNMLGKYFDKEGAPVTQNLTVAPGKTLAVWPQLPNLRKNKRAFQNRRLLV